MAELVRVASTCRPGWPGTARRLGVRGLALAVESRRPEVLFEWSERARMLASRVQPVRAPEDESIVADLTELREMRGARGRTASSPEREAELRQRVRERAWQHRGSGEVADPVTLDELPRALDDRHRAGRVRRDGRRRGRAGGHDGRRRPGSTSASAPRSGRPARRAAARPRRRRVRPARRDGRLRPRRSWPGGSAPSPTLLVAPVLDAVGDRRVVLTPSGVLAGVPWTLLPGLRRPPGHGRPVGDLVAGPSYDAAAVGVGRLRRRPAGRPRRGRGHRRRQGVAGRAGPGRREAATAAAVCELAETVDVLHVAAHGRHSAENPMFSGLQLADGPWFGYDIDRLRRVPDVVLLSACEVGRSTVRWGEELIGMTTAWLHAGARCVIASAAAVNDQAAYDVLVAVHQQLAAGVDPAAALAAAVPAVSADTAPVPLVCFG